MTVSVLLAVLAVTPDAGASGGGVDRPGDDTLTVFVTADGQYQSAGNGTGAVTCQIYDAGSLSTDPIVVLDPQDGVVYVLRCVDGNGVVVRNQYFTYRLGQTVINPATLALEARRELRVARPEPLLSPVNGSPTLAGIWTWTWLAPDRWAPARATASLPGIISVTATATPYKSVYENLDTGETYTCSSNGGRGVPYDFARDESEQRTTDCRTVFQTAGRHRLRVASYWRVTWTSTALAGTNTLPDLVTSNEVSVEVIERQPVVVG